MSTWRKEIGQVKVTLQGLGARGRGLQGLGARAPRGLGPRPPERLVSVALKSFLLGGRCGGGGGLEGSGHGIPPLPQGRKEEKPSNTPPKISGSGPKKYPSYEDLQQGTPSFEKVYMYPLKCVACVRPPEMADVQLNYRKVPAHGSMYLEGQGGGYIVTILTTFLAMREPKYPHYSPPY